MKNVNKKIIVPAVVIMIVIAAAIGVSIAYFTEKTSVIDNTVTVGNVKTELEEPSYNPEDGENLTPNEEVPKDPKVKNTGTNSAYVFVAVSVPKEEVILVGQSELLSNKEMTELFTYNVNSGWEEISVDTSDSKHNVHIYAYTNGALNSNQTTNPVFDKIKFKNVLEGELDTSKEYVVNVKSYAIQSDTIKTEGSTNKDKMTYIYNNYLKNGNGEGAGN